MADYVIVNGELYHAANSDELMHYGVLGMKWGVRRGRASDAYGKASKKLKKLDDRVEKARAKSRKAAAKSDNRQYGFATPGMRKRSARKARRASYKAVKSARKAQKWVSRMEKTFGKTSISLTTEQTALGKKYLEMIDMRVSTRY